MASEQEIIARNEEVGDKELVTAYTSVPYALVNNWVKDFGYSTAYDVLQELTEISKYYKVYKKGISFTPEGTNGDYIPADLHYKMSASLIDKEARFLFAESPSIEVQAKGDLGKISNEAKDNITVINDLVRTILNANNFEELLVKAAKDCFIGKRVAGMINFNEEDGVTVTFLPSNQFLYETKMGNPNVITKFVAFIVVCDSVRSKDKRIFAKKFTLEPKQTPDGESYSVWLEEYMYDGAGSLIEEVTERCELLLDRIPVALFINDGLLGDVNGQSEIEVLQYYEKYYSRLSNADIDAERKSMNPTKYTVNMDSRSTKGLSTSAGAFWDLMEDQNLDKGSASVGMLESNMSYSSALKTSLDRVKTTAYEQIDMPNITLETMTGSITSGKALKAIYWGLIVRCKEKMKMWGPNLQNMVDIIIDGAYKYPNTITRYTNAPELQPVDYMISVEQNIPLPEDEIEEKQQDLTEVESNVRSKKSYMKKWFGLTDEQVQEELEQMAKEREMIEDVAMFGGSVVNVDKEPYPDANNAAAIVEEPVEEVLEVD